METNNASRVLKTTASVTRKIIVWVKSLIDSVVIWNRARIAKKLRLVEEEQRRAKEYAHLRRMALERQRQEIANATKPVNKRWESRKGVESSEVITYGTGSKYVYCYSFPSTLKIAELTGSVRYNIKVGMASRHPIGRIQEQISASKTAMSEPAVVLLVFQTDDCADLEKWMHKHLDRSPEALGREWFVSNPEQLLTLFRRYVALRIPVGAEGLEFDDSDF